MCPNLIGSSWGHEHSTPPIGFAVEGVVRTHTHRYNIAAVHVERSHTHKYNITIKVTRTHTHIYTVGHGLVVSKTHRWNSGGKVSKTKRHKWDITRKITRTHTHKFIISIKVTKTHTHVYKVNGRIYRTHTHKWNSAGHLYENAVKTHKYNVVGRVTKTHTHKYDIFVPILLDTDLQYYKSTATNSLGGAITATVVTTSLKHDLFDVVSAAEMQTGDTEYRCIYVKNISSRSVLANSKVWINSNTPSSSSVIGIGLGTSAVDGTEQTIGTEGTAPSGVSFQDTVGIANALAIGTLNAGQHKAVWVRRVISVGASGYPNDTFTIAFGGDTDYGY